MIIGIFAGHGLGDRLKKVSYFFTATYRSHLTAGAASTRSAQSKMADLLRARPDPVDIPSSVPRLPLGQVLREPLRNGRSARRAAGGGGVRALTLTAITRRSFRDEFTKLVDIPRAEIQDLWLQDGDIFVQRSNTADLVGSSAIYRGAPGWAIFPDLLIRVRPDLDVVLPEYVSLVLQAESTRRHFRRSARGLAGSMPKIDQTSVAAVPIPILSVTEQAAWASRVAELNANIDRASTALETALHRNRALSSELLAAAFRGELVDQDPDDEPADVVLARIRAEREAALASKKSKPRTRKAAAS